MLIRARYAQIEVLTSFPGFESSRAKATNYLRRDVWQKEKTPSRQIQNEWAVKRLHDFFCRIKKYKN
ncbi:hypothetical protein DESC_780212 [Desulfosarcina cetonica]|nr:hypothetical protein DESC_780212 [Desulfosarcina cetonica]